MHNYTKDWTKPPFRHFNKNEFEEYDPSTEAVGIQHPVTDLISRKGNGYKLNSIPDDWTESDQAKGIGKTRPNQDTHLYTRLTDNKIGSFRGKTLVIYSAPDVQYRCVSSSSEAKAEANLLKERLESGRHKHKATRFGKGYLIEEKQSTFIDVFQDTAFSLEEIYTEEAASVREDAEHIKGFSVFASSPMYQIKNSNGKVVGGIRDRTVIAYDNFKSDEAGKTPRIFDGRRPTDEENYEVSETLDDLLEGNHTFSDSSSLTISSKKTSYSGVNDLSEEIIAEQFD